MLCIAQHNWRLISLFFLGGEKCEIEQMQTNFMWYKNPDVCQYLATGVEKFDSAELLSQRALYMYMLVTIVIDLYIVLYL